MVARSSDHGPGASKGRGRSEGACEETKAQQKVQDARAKLAALAKLSSSERALLGVGLSAEDKRLVKGLGPKKSPTKKVSK